MDLCPSTLPLSSESKPHRKKDTFKTEEDEKLISLVVQHGDRARDEIERLMP
jgi:hypothetical protein